MFIFLISGNGNNSSGGAGKDCKLTPQQQTRKSVLNTALLHGGEIINDIETVTAIAYRQQRLPEVERELAEGSEDLARLAGVIEELEIGMQGEAQQKLNEMNNRRRTLVAASAAANDGPDQGADTRYHVVTVGNASVGGGDNYNGNGNAGKGKVAEGEQGGETNNPNVITQNPKVSFNPVPSLQRPGVLLLLFGVVAMLTIVLTQSLSSPLMAQAATVTHSNNVNDEGNGSTYVQSLSAISEITTTAASTTITTTTPGKTFTTDGNGGATGSTLKTYRQRDPAYFLIVGSLFLIPGLFLLWHLFVVRLVLPGRVPNFLYRSVVSSSAANSSKAERKTRRQKHQVTAQSIDADANQNIITNPGINTTTTTAQTEEATVLTAPIPPAAAPPAYSYPASSPVLPTTKYPKANSNIKAGALLGEAADGSSDAFGSSLNTPTINSTADSQKLKADPTSMTAAGAGAASSVWSPLALPSLASSKAKDIASVNPGTTQNLIAGLGLNLVQPIGYSIPFAAAVPAVTHQNAPVPVSNENERRTPSLPPPLLIEVTPSPAITFLSKAKTTTTPPPYLQKLDELEAILDGDSDEPPL